MTTTCVIGVQWGDEGKGKVVDLLAAEHDCVVRYQGGGNAGHTVVVGGRKHVLHMIPSGIFHRGIRCVIAHGIVVDLPQLSQELDGLEARGIDWRRRLWISDRAHLVLPYHKRLDAVAERSRDATRIGTTLRGIGPCYADKAARRGLRVGDLWNPRAFRERLAEVTREKNRILRALYGERPLDPEAIARECLRVFRRVRPCVVDTVALLNRQIARGRDVLFEGAQGSLLNLDFGTYPYVTSSSCDACGVTSGAGVSPKRIGRIVGVMKAYTTRVGEGPFPSEEGGRIGEWLRQRGQEYGATTGRPRRCGWFDLVSTRFAVEVNGVDELAVTKLDVLSGLDEVPVCVAYRLGRKRIEHLPSRSDLLGRLRPIYRRFPGWKEELSGMLRVERFPPAARRYLDFLQRGLGVPFRYISTSRERADTIRLP